MDCLKIFEIVTLVLVCVYPITISVIKLVNFFSYDYKLKKINLLREYKNLLDNKIIDVAKFEKSEEECFRAISSLVFKVSLKLKSFRKTEKEQKK